MLQVSGQSRWQTLLTTVGSAVATSPSLRRVQKMQPMDPFIVGDGGHCSKAGDTPRLTIGPFHATVVVEETRLNAIGTNPPLDQPRLARFGPFPRPTREGATKEMSP